MMLQLYDTFVRSILGYSCEVWGFSSEDRCERVHRKYLKRILCVKMSTNNAALYGETGRFPLFIDRYSYVRIIKYWLKIVKPDYDNGIVNGVFYTLVNEKMTNENAEIYYNEQDFTMFGYIHQGGVKLFIPLLKVRIRDQYIAEWNENF